MVRVQDLSGKLVVALELDLLSYQARCQMQEIQAGAQLPRTRYGWLAFNRERGLPADSKVFKDSTQYARCLAPIEVNDSDEIMYKSANDSVWKSRLTRQVT